MWVYIDMVVWIKMCPCRGDLRYIYIIPVRLMSTHTHMPSIYFIAVVYTPSYCYLIDYVGCPTSWNSTTMVYTFILQF